MNDAVFETSSQEAEFELCEGVDELRKCSFKPDEHFVRIPGFKPEDGESYYLEVKWREFWFQRYCDEQGIQQRSIEELPVTLIAGTSFLQAVAVVKMNGDVIGRGVGGYNIANGDIAYAVQIASTIAKGRALANAGFGTVFSSSRTSESGGAEIPCDSGVKTSEFFIRRSPKNPMFVTANEQALKSEQIDVKPENNAPAEDNRPAPAPAGGMTREDALRFQVTVRGKHYGEALGDVMGKDPKAVKYYAENTRYAGSELQTAAKLILAQ